jgi:hypothetical protein
MAASSKGISGGFLPGALVDRPARFGGMREVQTAVDRWEAAVPVAWSRGGGH